ncbi:MarR family transcriptional regulator [Paenibacillus sp. HB172176]|uniref:MarR family transcriptional regulator n=1 Tax=Paenibacillus sp. HB172176 TaxID=2493690 RepID=UPI00143C80BF|nr:MarR family transcriptional regulator [Paenibacillus sp. HB172176]
MSEGIKRLLYERFLHFTHVTEQMFTAEIDEFVEFAKLQGMTSIPNNLTSVHVIDCIGNHEPVNNTTIAEKMDLSKASISKISAKLLQEGYIKRSQLKDNKKEIYFSLSAKGRRIFDAHAEMHELFEQRFMTVMSSFSEAELQASLKFFETMLEKNQYMIKGDEKA